MEIILDPDLDINNNAARYFEKAKKHRKKAEKTKEALKLLEEKKNKILEKIQEVRQRVEERIVEEQQIREKAKKKKWFHSYRWFITINGFLVVGGRDASSNESLIKKHTEKKDLVLHCELRGSPFIVVKNGENAPKEDIEEAARFAVTFSRAWREGIYSYNVAIAKPEQVVKTPRSGEYLPRGAFILRGDIRNIRGELDLALGIYEDFLMSGPKKSVSKWCESYLILRPGNIEKGVIAKKIARMLNTSIEEVLHALPAGGFSEEIQKYKNS
ncbi:DUF814 domain-containing protein [Candidatus Woesearchaeota archaeon]|nr:DUF814 domain-containing protein [Candidatus Woesearchaeota archaeon]